MDEESYIYPNVIVSPTFEKKIRVVSSNLIHSKMKNISQNIWIFFQNHHYTKKHLVEAMGAKQQSTQWSQLSKKPSFCILYLATLFEWIF